MLYDPKWEVKVDPLSIDAVIAWLEQKPAKKHYCYLNSGKCLAAQYNQSIGRKYSVRRGIEGLDVANPFDIALEDIAIEQPRTFGAALDRARAFVTDRAHKL